MWVNWKLDWFDIGLRGNNNEIKYFLYIVVGVWLCNILMDYYL